MNTSLKLTILFFSISIAGTLAGATLVMFGYDLCLFVAGSDVPFFSGDFFLRGIFISFPLVCVAALTTVVLYFIRHPTQRFLPQCTYVLFALFSWLVLIPLSTGLYYHLEETYFEKPTIPPVSPSYFRVHDGNVYFYSRIYQYGSATRDVYGEGLLIDLMGIRGKSGMIYPFSTSLVVRDDTYADIIFKDALRMPPVVAAPVSAYVTLMATARAALSSGVIPWLVFASLGFAFFAVWWLRSISSWRFLNAALVLTAAIVVAVLNYLIYTGFLLQSASFACRALCVSVGQSLPSLFAGITRITEPLACIINLVLGLLFFALGKIRVLVKKNAQAIVQPYAQDDDEEAVL